MHRGKGKYEATTCTTESQQINYFHKRKHSEVKEKAEKDCTKQIHPSTEHERLNKELNRKLYVRGMIKKKVPVNAVVLFYFILYF